MATKKDLIEAQGFSRRRLLSAFTGGAPGGKELEPAKPLRAVVAGVALTAMLILGGVFYGLVRPGLPQGWEQNRLLLVGDTGARYVSVDGVLHPVINTTSARLLAPAGEFRVVTTNQDALAGIGIGGTVGILGAPDELPAADALIGDGWTACTAPGPATAVALPARPIAAASPRAAVVERDGELFVVAGGRRHPVAAAESSAVLRAAGLDTTSPVEVEGRWLSLFEPGSPLEPLLVDGAGESGAGGLAVGAVVHAEGSPADERYLMRADGELAPISPLAYQLYLLGSGATLGGERSVSPAEIAALPTSTEPAGAGDWPDAPLEGLPSDEAPCAVLVPGDAGPTTVFGTLLAGAELAEPSTERPVDVASGGGALVSAGGASGPRIRYLIDESGTAFPIPERAAADTVSPSADELVARLGYRPDEVVPVDDAWLQLFAIGPALTPEAAGATPGTADASAGSEG